MAAADPFAHLDAAYAMGALEPGDEAEFGAHLQTCPDCRSRVEAALATVAMLGPPVLDDRELVDEPVPDTLLPGLLRRARQERRRRRTVTAAIAAVAAACLVALLVVLWPSSTTSGHAPPAQTLRAVGVSHITATAALVPKDWGTEIDVRCRYSERDVAGAHTYGLRVIDTSGTAYPAGSWTLVDARGIDFTGGTEVRRERIAKVQVTLADGTPILQLTL